MCLQTMPLARDQSGVLSVPFKPLTPLHKTLTDVNLAAMAAAAGVQKVWGAPWGNVTSALLQKPFSGHAATTVGLAAPT